MRSSLCAIVGAMVLGLMATGARAQSGNPRAVIETSKGTIVVELYAD